MSDYTNDDRNDPNSASAASYKKAMLGDMTGIPDEVVEIVARAIHSADIKFTEWDKLSPINLEYYRDAARAALSASGYVEMRNALEALIVDDNGSFGGNVEYWDRIDRARAALKAGDQT